MKSNGLNIWKKFIYKNRAIYSVGVLTIVLTGISQVFSTRMTGWIIDFFQDQTNSLPSYLLPYSEKNKNFLFLFFILFLSRIFLTIGRYGWRMTLARQTHVASSYLKKKLWDNARWFKQKDLQEKYTKGVLMNASTSDVGAARFIFGFTIVGFLDVIFLGAISLFAMFNISVPLTFYSLSVLIFIPFLVKKLSKLEIERYQFSQETLGKFNDLVTQSVSSVRLQRLTQTGKFWTKKLMSEADDYRNIRLKAIFTSLRYYPLMGGISVSAYVVLFFIGMNFVFSGKISVGDFVAMQGLILLVQDPLLELGYVISDWKKSTTSLKRLNDVYEHPKEDFYYLDSEGQIDKQMGISANKPVFEVKDLYFQYEQRIDKNDIEDQKKHESREIFNGLDLNIYQGDRIGLTGAIGTGKTTFINILAGLERNFKGQVHFSGESFESYGHDYLRDKISIVSQRPFLFASNIKENIQMGRDLEEDKIWKYLNLAGLDRDVEGFTDKLQTPLGEWGINLSGGQKQRLTLARALSCESDLIILDDCLSAVDTVTEEKILDNLDKFFKDKTIIWVAHRKSTLKKCNRIIDFNNLLNDKSLEVSNKQVLEE